MILKTYPIYLYLEDGTVCQGLSFVNSIISIGEIVFNTGMTGYQEVMTDPSYCNQIILFTYPEIGNTGINPEDMESSKLYVRGIIARNFSVKYSNWRSSISFIRYLIENKIPHVFGIDTRFVVKYIRDKGVMLACISNYKLNSSMLLEKVNNFIKSQTRYLAYEVSTSNLYHWSSKSVSKMKYYTDRKFLYTNNLKVIVIDLGVKFNILNRLKYYGCSVTVVPALTTYDSIIHNSPDGVLLSNGPGDPAIISEVRSTILKLVNANIPLFGICLGHQLLSLALGGKTSKLKFGHRGLNHPSGLYSLVRMTSQNHGFVVSVGTLPEHLVSLTYFNLNDNTIAGIVHKNKPCFSVQYHPEASPGPHDSDDLFLHFINVMLACKYTN